MKDQALQREIRDAAGELFEASLPAADGDFYRRIVEISPGMAVVLCNEQIIYINPAGVKMLGAADSEPLLGKLLHDVFPTAEADFFLEQIRSASSENRVCRFEYSLRIGEAKVWFDGAVSPISRSVVVWNARDITESKQNETARDIERERLEKALARSEAQLRQSQRLESIGRWAGGIAHDFNNMLTVINGYSELTLRRLKKNGFLRGNLEEIKKAGARSALLTQQLLAFSRQEAFRDEVIDLNRVINEVCNMLMRLVSKDIRLVVRLNPQLGRVRADAGRLSHVIMNLVADARDRMPQGGTLTIEAKNLTVDEEFTERHIQVGSGAYVELTVGDEGSSIDVATRRNILEPFHTSEDVGPKTNPGLAAVDEIVKQSGGYIFADSKIGKGTIFKIYLPRVDDEEVELPKEDKASGQIPEGTETILIVDDEDIVRALTRRILEESGYRVIEARDGAEALTVFEQPDCKIDLLMTNLVTPRTGGRELAKYLASSHPSTRILFASDYSDEANVHRAESEFGANFIEKPFAPDALARKVRELLDEIDADGHA